MEFTMVHFILRMFTQEVCHCLTIGTPYWHTVQVLIFFIWSEQHFQKWQKLNYITVRSLRCKRSTEWNELVPTPPSLLLPLLSTFQCTKKLGELFHTCVLHVGRCRRGKVKGTHGNLGNWTLLSFSDLSIDL